MFWELLSLYWFTIIVYCVYCPEEDLILGGTKPFWYVFACFNLGMTMQQWVGR